MALNAIELKSQNSQKPAPTRWNDAAIFIEFQTHPDYELSPTSGINLDHNVLPKKIKIRS